MLSSLTWEPDTGSDQRGAIHAAAGAGMCMIKKRIWPKSLNFQHRMNHIGCDETEMKPESYRKRGRGEKEEGKERAKEEEENKARTNIGLETAAQASPEGTTEMGWKTNQGHRGDFAAAHLPPPPSPCSVPFCSAISPLAMDI